jgi:hypothetical protein
MKECVTTINQTIVQIPPANPVKKLFSIPPSCDDKISKMFGVGKSDFYRYFKKIHFFHSRKGPKICTHS